MDLQVQKQRAQRAIRSFVQFVARKNQISKFPLGFLLSLFVLTIIKYQFRSIRYSLGMKAEMWAEGATNYFDCAHQSLSFFSCYLVKDAGYLAFLPRIYSQIINAVSPNFEAVVYFQQFFALATVIVCCASVCLDVFSKIFGPFPLRFLLSILLAAHFDYELHTFINASYYLIIPVSGMLGLQLLRNRPSNASSFGAGLLTALAILSKGIMVCLVPMSALVLFSLMLRRLWKNCLIIAVPVIAAGSLQLYTMLDSYSQGAFSKNKASSVVELIWTIVATFTNGFISIFHAKFSFSSAQSLQNVLAFILVFLTLWSIRVFSRQPLSTHRFLSLFFKSSLPLLFLCGALAAHAISVSALIKVSAIDKTIGFPFSGRQWFVQGVLLLLCSWHLVVHIFNDLRYLQYFVLLSGFLAILYFGIPFAFEESKFVKDHRSGLGFSNWNAFAKHFTPNVKCAPINPYPWLYSKGCAFIGEMPPLKTLERNLKVSDRLVVSVAELADKDKMILVGFYIDSTSVKQNFYLKLMLSNGSSNQIESLQSNGGNFVFFYLPSSSLVSVQTIYLRNRAQTQFKVAFIDGHTPESAAMWIRAN